jgi:hypothetical protein
MISKLTYLSSVVRGLVCDHHVLPRRGLVLDRHAPLNRRGLVPDRHAKYLRRGLVLDRHASRDLAFACLSSISRHTPFLLAAHPILHSLPSSFQRIRRGIR